MPSPFLYHHAGILNTGFRTYLKIAILQRICDTGLQPCEMTAEGINGYPTHSFLTTSRFPLPPTDYTTCDSSKPRLSVGSKPLIRVPKQPGFPPNLIRKSVSLYPKLLCSIIYFGTNRKAPMSLPYCTRANCQQTCSFDHRRRIEYEMRLCF